jgi:secondary thiamine-phosphate synthase enzyme
MEFEIKTRKEQEIVDITEKVKEIVRRSKVKEGLVCVYTPHATAAIIINENWDPNVCLDFIDALNKLVPKGIWRHDKVDGNGDAHIKAALVGPSEALIVKNGDLVLGQWQNIMLVDFDGPRVRRVIVEILSR